ncbi:hypothetical protein MIND_00281400 [Mycena indigotica]|uniref:DUF6534 domain-containing protein n=1 Tax=Mycena indigotica TaxID=2126181 RepID=A0A8H6T9H9_9AGAR|nr:uncharacterized protein MIND_00281400 [Mycena indigotica]KAF7312671.1 hypothetical protein MIND_00281400 [Mycena indigotica]
MVQPDLTIGCLLIASWINTALYTLQITQTIRYFIKYSKDQWFNKACVLGALVSDTVTTVAVMVSCYLYTVTHWGNEAYLGIQPWCMPAYVLGTTLTAMIVQAWLVKMIYTLTRQWFWLPIIVLLVLTGVVGGCLVASHLINDPTYVGRDSLVREVTIWLSGAAVADLLITVLLVWKFRSLRSDFADTKNLLRRLTIASLRNGTLTTLLTVVSIIVFQAQPELNTATMIEMTLGRIYTLSMLSNLNNRALMPGNSAQSTTSNARKTILSHDQSPTVLRIRQDVETHYQSDADSIPMDSTGFGRRTKEDLESGDGSSEVVLPVVVTVRQEKHYHTDY